MQVNIILIAFVLIQSIRLCYQQDITVCSIGYEYINGTCVPQACPVNEVRINGVCQPSSAVLPPCANGFNYINGVCTQQGCPSGYTLVNGVCHSTVTYPPPTQQTCQNGYTLVNGICHSTVTYPPPIQGTIPPTISCPNGYMLFNGWCYQSSPCQQQTCNTYTTPATTSSTSTSTSTSTTTTTTTTTTTPPPLPPPPPEEIRACPPDSVLVDGVCRLIYCTKGTNHKGRCIEPVCTDGLVWTGQTCGNPEIITTILEIENSFTTEVNKTDPVIHTPETVNNVVYHTEAYEETTERKDCPTTTEVPTLPPPSASTKCCKIITPRMCKPYTGRWVCFNRQYRRCDSVCGNNTLIYLRVPKVIERNSFLVVPPNPPLKVCADEECNTKDLVDCSGCAKNERKHCSAYCYRYRCPEKRCTFIDQSEYCTNYPGSPGCSSSDGCFHEWCTDDTQISTKCQ